MGQSAAIQQSLLEHLLDVQRPDVLSRRACLEIPQLPRRHRHERVGVDGHDVEIVSKLRVHFFHLVGKSPVPTCIVSLPLRWEPFEYRLGHGRLHGVGCQLASTSSRVMAFEKGLLHVQLVEPFPGLVVVWPARVGDAPIRHRALRITGHGIAEAPFRLEVVEAVRPVEPAVEPRLARGRGGRHLEGIRAEVVGVLAGGRTQVHRRARRFCRSDGRAT